MGLANLLNAALCEFRLTRWKWWRFNVGEAGVRRRVRREGGCVLRVDAGRSLAFKEKGDGVELTHKLDFGARWWVGITQVRV